MAKIIGCMALSHGPQLLMPPEKWQDLPDRVREPGPKRPALEEELTLKVKQMKFERCLEAMGVLRRQLEQWRPDVVVMVGDDQRENILEDNTPPFVIYTAGEVDATRKFHYLGESAIQQKRRFRVDESVASVLVEGLMEAGFDPAWSRKTRYEGGLGHAFGRPLHFIMPGGDYPIVPVMVNTYYPPAPSARRCFELGRALAASLETCKAADTAVVIGSGGLSHVRIDEELDQAFIKGIENYDRNYLMNMDSSVLMEGTSELRNWILTAGAADCQATVVDYVPCYRTNTGIGCAMGFAFWQC